MRYEIADPHLARALTALLQVTLAVDADAPCVEPDCPTCTPSEPGGRDA